MSDQRVYVISHKEVTYRMRHGGFGYRALPATFPDFYKIGVATDPESRLSYMQTGTPHELSLVTTIQADDAEGVEQKLHSILSHCCVRGEWFNLITPDLNSLKGFDRLTVEELSELQTKYLVGERDYDASIYVEVMRIRNDGETYDVDDYKDDVVPTL